MSIKEALSKLNELCHSSFNSEADLTVLIVELDELMTEIGKVSDVAWLDASIRQSIFFNHQQASKEHASQRLKNEDSEVYLLRGSVTGYYKIGVSTNLKDRLRQVHNGIPEDTMFIFSSTGGRELESYLHEKYKDKKIKGEWFCLNKNDVAEIKRVMGERK